MKTFIVRAAAVAGSAAIFSAWVMRLKPSNIEHVAALWGRLDGSSGT